MESKKTYNSQQNTNNKVKDTEWEENPVLRLTIKP